MTETLETLKTSRMIPKPTEISFETKKSPKGQEVSSEVRNQLKTFTNKKFLESLNQDERLEYISDKKSSGIKEGEIITFDFKVNGVVNKELWQKTTAGQVLPKQVRKVKLGEQIFTRGDTLLGEFFDENNSRLIINDKTKIIVSKFGEVKENNDKKTKFSEKYPDYGDLVSLAIDKGIDPDFAVFAFGDKIKDIDLLNLSRKSDIEDMLTEFDRIRGLLDSFSFENNKYPDELVVRLLKRFNPDSYKHKSIEYGVKEEEIKKYENLKLSEEEFFSQAKELSVKIEEKYGIPRQVVLGQALLESNNGKSKLTELGKNAFGHKASSGQNSIGMTTSEFRNGDYQSEVANFRAFDTLEDSFESYAKLLLSDRYSNAFNYKENPREFLEKIIQAGYATTPPEEYVSRVESRLASFGEKLA